MASPTSVVVMSRARFRVRGPATITFSIALRCGRGPPGKDTLPAQGNQAYPLPSQVSSSDVSFDLPMLDSQKRTRISSYCVGAGIFHLARLPARGRAPDETSLSARRTASCKSWPHVLRQRGRDPCDRVRRRGPALCRSRKALGYRRQERRDRLRSKRRLACGQAEPAVFAQYSQSRPRSFACHRLMERHRQSIQHGLTQRANCWLQRRPSP